MSADGAKNGRGRVGGAGAVSAPDESRLNCPYCDAFGVERLYLAMLRVDSCVCASCGARWDEDTQTGAFRGRRSTSRT